jgi:hypothetical protein
MVQHSGPVSHRLMDDQNILQILHHSPTKKSFVWKGDPFPCWFMYLSFGLLIFASLQPCEKPAPRGLAAAGCKIGTNTTNTKIGVAIIGKTYFVMCTQLRSAYKKTEIFSLKNEATRYSAIILLHILLQLLMNFKVIRIS